jgi:outer membrane protein assembly factor BamB
VPQDAFAGGTDGPVQALAVSGGRLYAGGRFRNANGAPRRNLASFDAGTGALGSLAVPFDAGVFTLAAGDGRLYAAGDFRRAGGRLHPSLAAIDLRTSALVKAFNAPRRLSRATLRFAAPDVLVPAGKRLFAGGGFEISRTVKRGGKRVLQSRRGLVVARASDGAVDWSVDAHIEGTVSALLRDRRTLYVGGELVRRSGTRIVRRKGKVVRRVPMYRQNLVAIDPVSGALKRGFHPAPRGSISELALAGSRLYVAGNFDRLAGRRRDGLAAIDPASGRLSAQWSPEPGGGDGVSALLADGQRVYAGGDFKTFGPIARPNFAILAADGLS